MYGTPRQLFILLTLLLVMFTLPLLPCVAKADPKIDKKAPRSWPMFGGSPSRNMVNLSEQNLPADWSVEKDKGKNIKWTAKLGGATFSTPVVAHGIVFIGTKERNLGLNKTKAVMKAFRETDGKFLWQNFHAIIGEDGYRTAGYFGMLSTPTVDNRQLYYVTPACEVICVDYEDGKVIWTFDMIKELKVVPFQANMCSPLVVDDLIFVVTANGADLEGNIPAPLAPSFVALDKMTGKLVWQSNLPNNNIIEGQWSSPAFAVANEIPQVIFAGGDGVIYSFMPRTGELLWKCDCLPEGRKKDTTKVDNYFLGTPVIVGKRLYIGQGVYPEHHASPRSSYFLCLDITRKGDVSLKSYDPRAPINKDSALVWASGGPIVPRPQKGRTRHFGTTMSTAAVHDGLVYITEENGYLHCLDAATGRPEWTHDLRAGIWGSPYWVDGRIFVGTQDGEIVVFAHGRSVKILATIDMEDVIYSTPVAANGVLFVATHSALYAIGRR
jgi:outer membrane protein assembly factor BamB